jgi:hypothetical protein
VPPFGSDRKNAARSSLGALTVLLLHRHDFIDQRSMIRAAFQSSIRENLLAILLITARIAPEGAFAHPQQTPASSR